MMARDMIARFVINGVLPAVFLILSWPASLTSVLVLLLGFVAMAVFWSWRDGYRAGRGE